MVVVGTGSVGTRFVDKDYPSAVGLVAGTTMQQEEPSLIPSVKDLTTD